MANIVVQGEGVAVARPDICRIEYGLFFNQKDYQKVLSEAKERMGKLTDILLSKEINASKITTEELVCSIQASSKRKEVHGKWVDVADGYNFYYRGFFECSIEDAINVIPLISGLCDLTKLEYDVKDIEKLKVEAASVACKNAKAVASKVAATLKCKLGNIKDVVCDEIDDIYHPRFSLESETAKALVDFPISSADIVCNASVRVTWETIQ